MVEVTPGQLAQIFVHPGAHFGQVLLGMKLERIPAQKGILIQEEQTVVLLDPNHSCVPSD